MSDGPPIEQSKTTPAPPPRPNDAAYALLKADVARLTLAIEGATKEAAAIREAFGRLEKLAGDIAGVLDLVAKQ